MSKNYKKGFSLVELMISLIAISLITAAFVPVITKKLNADKITISQEFETNCEEISSNCKICNNQKCLTCSNVCATGERLEVETCTCKKCPMNCKNCNENMCLACNDGYFLKNNDCISCALTIPNCQNCTSETNCTKCRAGSGKYAINGECINCPTSTMVERGNICITKYNVGDKGITIPSSANVKVVQTNGEVCQANGDSTAKCCWQGQTGNPEFCTTVNGYSGCNRTVCTWAAGYEICKAMSMRLPTQEEISLWRPITYPTEENYNLNLCAWEIISDVNIAICSEQPLCNGAYGNRCLAMDNWSGTDFNSDYAGYVNEGDTYFNFGQGTDESINFEFLRAYAKDTPRTVRCVADKS